jgi:hypothetical protein
LDSLKFSGPAQIDKQHSYPPLAPLEPAMHRTLAAPASAARSCMTEISAVGGSDRQAACRASRQFGPRLSLLIPMAREACPDPLSPEPDRWCSALSRHKLKHEECHFPAMLRGPSLPASGTAGAVYKRSKRDLRTPRAAARRWLKADLKHIRRWMEKSSICSLSRDGEFGRRIDCCMVMRPVAAIDR